MLPFVRLCARVALGAAMCAMTLGAAEAMKTYTSPTYHVSVTYPTSWIDKGTATQDLLNPDYKGPYNAFGFGPRMDGEIMVSVVPSQPMTREAFVAKLTSIFAPFDPSVKVNSATDVTVNGRSGFDITYGKGSDLGRVRVMIFYANGKRYIIEAMGFDERKGEYDSYAADIEHVFQSFTIAS